MLLSLFSLHYAVMKDPRDFPGVIINAPVNKAHKIRPPKTHMET
jgi:hypothetical protein